MIAIAYGGNNTAGSIDVATAVNAHGGPSGRMDFESETFIADASEDGTGRGTPLGPVNFQTRGSNIDIEQGIAATIGSNADRASGSAPCIAFAENSRAELRLCGGDGQVSAQLTTGGGKPGQGMPCIAFSAKDHGGDAQLDLSPTLRAGGFTNSHANAGVMPAVAFQPRFARNGRSAPDEIASALTGEAGRTGKGDSAQCVAIQERAVSENIDNGPQGKGYQDDLTYTLEARNKVQAVAASWAVRRLTPMECERLQGFPDGYTAIPKAADGPRYKALGNSMAVNAMRWLGRRIDMVSSLGASS